MSTQVATKAESGREPAARRGLSPYWRSGRRWCSPASWALLQPYRITLLDPAGQGFWWLVSQPPLYAIAVGVIFHLAIAPGVVADLEEAGESP